MQVYVGLTCEALYVYTAGRFLPNVAAMYLQWLIYNYTGKANFTSCDLSFCLLHN